MRAAVLTAFRAPLSVEDVPEPACPADGVVLETLACGVCRSDWHGWCGTDQDVRLPHVPGHEFCGTIVEAGREVRDWRPGDRVIAPFVLACGACPDCRAGDQTACATQIMPGFTAPGAFAERVAVPRADQNLAHLPDWLNPDLAAAFGCRVTTVWHALTGRARLAPGEWLAIHGTGGIGLAAVLLGQAMGARVIATDTNAERRAHAERFGAVAVDAASEPWAAIEEITGGGAHVSVDALGIPETVSASLLSLRPLGRHVQIGYPGREHAWAELPLGRIYDRQLALFGTNGMPAHRFPALFRLVEGGRVDLSPMIARRVTLDDASAELAAFDGPQPPGIAVITRFAA